MIKVFIRDEKLNVVDDRNAFVGFDFYQCCCESFGYKIEDRNGNVLEDDDPRLRRCHFDPDFFESVSGEYYEDGGGAKFKLIREDAVHPFYLTIYNSHNGYYGHGFSFTVDGHTKQSGCL